MAPELLGKFACIDAIGAGIHLLLQLLNTLLALRALRLLAGEHFLGLLGDLHLIGLARTGVLLHAGFLGFLVSVHIVDSSSFVYFHVQSPLFVGTLEIRKAVYSLKLLSARGKSF